MATFVGQQSLHQDRVGKVQVDGAALLPGAAFFELAAVAACTALSTNAHALTSVTDAAIVAPFRLPAVGQSDVVICCQLNLTTGSCCILSQSVDDLWTTQHMTCMSCHSSEPNKSAGSALKQPETTAFVYAARGMPPTADSNASAAAPRHVCSEIEHISAAQGDGYRLHPGALDSALQLGQLGLKTGDGRNGALSSVLTGVLSS